MKNHPVNNDYVQNLQEGLLTEAALRMGKKEKGAKPRKTHVGEEDNMGNVATNSARRKNIKDVGMKPMSGTGPGEVRPHDSGSITTRKLKKVEEAVVSEANYPHKAGLSRGIDVDNRSKLAGHLRKTRNAPDKDSAIKSANDTERRPRFQTSPGQEKIVAAASDKALESNLNKRIDKDSDFSNFGTPPSLRKKKIDENSASTHDRIMKKLRSAGGGKEYAKKKAEAEGDVERKRLEAAPALASIQKESFDITDSRLSDEDAKIDQNVKTRGVKKPKGQKPVPMINSDGEKIGEQNSGTRPRSQDLNTRGRLNKSREGEGMLAKGKRFIKKKFA